MSKFVKLLGKIRKIKVIGLYVANYHCVLELILSKIVLSFEWFILAPDFFCKRNNFVFKEQEPQI